MTTNTIRAEWANKAIESFSKASEMEDEELDTKISDLLCNLQHLSELNDIDFNECLDRGSRNFQTEKS